MSPRRRFVLRLVVGAAVLALVVSRAHPSQLSIAWGPRVALGLLAAVFLLLAAYGAAALRWRLILGAGAPSWFYLWRLYLVGAFFSLFLPTLVGGDAVRAAAAAKAMPNSGAALASVVAERVIGVLGMLVFLVVGLLLAPDAMTRSGARFQLSLPPGLIAVGAVTMVVAGTTLAWWSRRSQRVRQFVHEGLDVVRRLRASPALFVRALALGLLVQGLHITVWAQLAANLHFGVPASAFLVFVPVVTLAAMLPITLSGLGVREGAWLVLLTPFGIAPADIVAYSLLYFGCLVCVGSLGGLAFVLGGTRWAPIAHTERPLHAP